MKRFFILITILLTFQTNVFSIPKKIDDLTKDDAKKMPKDRPSVALVLAGGGAKGFAHLPIMEYIEELDIPIDMIIGTSIGSIVGGFYAAGYKAKDIVEEFSEVDWSPIFTDLERSPYEDIYGIHGNNQNLLSLKLGSDFSLRMGKGLSNGQKAYELFKSLLLKLPSDIDFDELHIPFRAVVTDMLTGDALVLNDGDIAESIRASMSLPAVFEPVYMDGYYFMDGGLRYNLAINVAEKMGYDIIIAIDISQHVRDKPEIFSANPAVAILNTITIAQYTTTLQLLDKANLVVCPDISNFGTLDFKKSKIIYEEGLKSLDKYKDSFEKIRQQIYPNDYDENGNRISKIKTNQQKNHYNDYKDLVPKRIEIEGEYDKDSSYIHNCFDDIKNIPLSADNYKRFMNNVYLTGNYKSIRSRFSKVDGIDTLKLLLQRKEEKEIKIMLGTAFQQIITKKTSLKADLNLDLQFRGFTGIGSMFAIHGTFLTDFGGELYYMQPFNPYIFMSAKVNFLEDRYGTFGDDVENFSSFNHFKTFGSYLDFGLKTPLNNLLKFGVFYKFIRNSALSYSEDSHLKDFYYDTNSTDKDLSVFRQYFGINTNFTMSFIDSEVFSTKGIFIDSTSKIIAPFNKDSNNLNPLLLTEQIEAKVAIPLNKKLSFIVNGLFGMEFLDNFKENYALIAEEGFNSYNRVFFPSVDVKAHFGSTVTAATTCLQYKLTDNLTIFGGEALLRAEGTIGYLNYDWDDIIEDNSGEEKSPLLWSGTLGFGIKIKSRFNFLTRVGICSNYDEKITPILCIDMGNFRF